mmetsp:Transcript_6032/g.16422  ORF Transcript_6032/g.16422 Transcript_6032/m.16422 type:complete len:85 (-) Transcript_6032:375-629(-)
MVAADYSQTMQNTTIACSTQTSTALNPCCLLASVFIGRGQQFTHHGLCNMIHDRSPATIPFAIPFILRVGDQDGMSERQRRQHR